MFEEIASLVSLRSLVLSVTVPSATFVVVLLVHRAILRRVSVSTHDQQESTAPQVAVSNVVSGWINTYLLPGYCASSWDMTGGGGRRENFYDTDKALAHHLDSSNIARKVADLVQAIFDKEDHQISWRVCFIEKDSGPVGCLTAKELVATVLGIDASVVRVRRRLDVAAIKGKAIGPGDRVILITDVVTSGVQIVKAVEKIQRLGGIVRHVVAVVDREEPKIPAFSDMAITIHRIATIKDIAKLSKEKKGSAL